MRKSMTHPSGAVRTASWLGMAVLLAFSAGAAAEVTFNVPVTTCGPVFRQITGKADDDKKVQQWINSGLKKLLDTDTAAKNLPNFYSSAKKTFTRLKDKNLNAKLQALSSLDQDSNLSNVLMHELSHFSNTLGTVDHSYDDHAIDNTLTENEFLENAETYGLIFGGGTNSQKKLKHLNHKFH